MQQGIIFNMQRFSIHDGPGIRTTVFLKGCPLNCAWCHNPESQYPLPEVMVRAERCQGCGACVRVCGQGSAHIKDGRRQPAHCSACGDCVTACMQGALELVGRAQTVEQVMQEVMKDELFYDQSGGGVSFSGGEPLLQVEFLDGLLLACRQQGLHTVLDTCGYAPWEVLAKLVPLVDLFLFDVKLMDEERHIQFTGQSNRQILENLQRLTQIHRQVEVRVPIIPGVNDDRANLVALAAYLRPLPILGVRLLPYHNYGVPKYAHLGQAYRLPETLASGEIAVELSAAHLREAGLAVL